MRMLILLASLVLAACASTGGIPRQPFADISVPPGWEPYSREWVLIRGPEVTAARLIYFSQEPVEATLGAARQLLRDDGWAETRSERFVSPEGWNGVRADFEKGGDTCRVTVIEGPFATHVDYVVSRRER
jgi:hypothetical protein